MVNPILALGVDPGWARTGVTLVARHADRVECWGVRYLKAQDDRQLKGHVRQSHLDETRHRYFYDQLCELVEARPPHVIGVETYVIRESTDYEALRAAAAELLSFLGVSRGRVAFASGREFLAAFERPEAFSRFLEHLNQMGSALQAFKVAQGRGAAAKTYGVYTTVLNVARRYNIPVYSFTPTDLKMWACNARSASKGQVQASVEQRVIGMRDVVAREIRAKSEWDHVFDAAGHAVMAAERYIEFHAR